MSYLDRPDDLIQDTKQFIDSEYGKHLLSTLQETAENLLTEVADISTEHPERYAAKYSAIKDVLNLIYSPLEDHTPPRG